MSAGHIERVSQLLSQLGLFAILECPAGIPSRWNWAQSWSQLWNSSTVSYCQALPDLFYIVWYRFVPLHFLTWFWQHSVDLKHMALFLNSRFYSIDLYLPLCQQQTVLITIALHEVLTLTSVYPPTLFCCFKTALVILGPLQLHKKF